MSAQSETSGPPPGAPPTGWDQRPEGSDNPMPPVGHPSEAIRDAFAKLTELKEFAAYYVAARVDSIKSAVRRLGIYAGLGIIAGIVAATVVVVAIVLLLQGIAGAWAELFPTHAWLGDILTGVIFLIVAAIGIWVGLGTLRRLFHRAMVDKYERRQHQQRQQFGRDVRDEAASARGPAGKAH